MQCNIDRRGRVARLIFGLLTLVAAGVAIGLTLGGAIGGAWGWGLAAVLAALGLFGVYEARKGWCAVRAMGIRTPF